MFYSHYQKSILIFTVVLGVCSLLGARFVQADPAKTSIEPLLNAMSGAVVPGTGTILVRTQDAVGATVHAAGLVPGNVYTLWVTTFNYPKNCATTPCSPADVPQSPADDNVAEVSINFGASQIAGEDGTVDFTAYRAVGDLTGVYFGPGLLEPQKAQIHLVVRTHGPASTDPATLQEQLTMFNGGCPPNTCGNVRVAIHQP